LIGCGDRETWADFSRSPYFANAKLMLATRRDMAKSGEFCRREKARTVIHHP
jgi:hypothetical protein